MKRKAPLIWLAVVFVTAGLIIVLTRTPRQIVLTGMVTTDEVIVSSEIQGRLEQLQVREGDQVTNGQLLALIQPQEWMADVAYYTNSVSQTASQIAQAEADLKYQESQTSNQIRQAEATLASTEAQKKQAEADLENAVLNFKRQEDLFQRRVESQQAYDQARTARDAAQAHVVSLEKQVLAGQAAVALAKSSQEQVVARRAALQALTHQKDAASAQREKANVRLNYTQITSPTNGVVDTRAALPGEVVNPGQAIVTLIDPDKLWVRVDVEETYIDRIHLGDKLVVRLPSGRQREGTVILRKVDAEYATQRDVSRTKRDIKTFEIRLRCDNSDRSLAVGMTASVVLPLEKP
jgi:HlyD family secretion protein